MENVSKKRSWMKIEKIEKSNVVVVLVLLCCIVFSSKINAQFIGSVTCFNDKERAGGNVYPYNQSLFLSETGEEEWWDNIVEEIYHSGIDFSALLSRGYSPGRPSIDAGDPRKIPNMMEAMNRRNLGNEFKLAIFDDCPAGWTANHNYDQGWGHNTNTLFDCGNTDNYKYIWDYNLKVAIENIPDARRFKIDGRMVIFFWSVKPRWMSNIDNGNLKRILEHIRSACQKEFGFNPYLIVQDCWFDNDSQLNPSDVDGVHNWFSSARKITWSLHSRGNLPKIGVTNPGIRYEGQPDYTFNDPRHGETLKEGLEGTVNSGALITLCEGFTDAAETAAFWRSKDTTYYDYPNQRLNILRRYSQKAFTNKRLVQAEACDFFNDVTPGNKGESFREGDIDIQLTSDAFGGWNVFNAEAGEWLEWKELAIPENAQFEIRYAAEQAAQIQFVLGEQEGAILTLPPTGGNQVWANARDASFNIAQNSNHDLKIKIISGNVSLNYFTIIGEGSTGYVTIEKPVCGERYLQTDTISVKTSVNGFAGNIQKLELYVDSKFIGNSETTKIDTFLTGLPIGNHFIKIKATTEDGNFSIDSCNIYIGLNAYKISHSTIGEGSVILDPPGGTYVEGTQVSIFAQSESSFFFNEWSGNLSGDENPVNLVLNSDVEIVATFIDASNPDYKVNFQPDNSSTPDGYLKDAGLEYGVRDNGEVYGWLSGNNTQTRDRGTPEDVRYATISHMQTNENRTWEIEVANGTYVVYLVMGDASYSDQINTVNIEGILKKDKNTEGNFDEYHVEVEVKDNRLTVSPGEGAENAKICFVEITADKLTGIKTSNLGTANFELEQNYPNPFNNETKISFKLGKTAHTRLTVYNAFGQQITTLVNEKMPSGTHQVKFNADNLPSGFYFYRMQCGNNSMVRKMLLKK